MRIRQRAKVNGVFPEVDDNVPQSSTCSEVPSDVPNDETYYGYDEFERPTLAKGADSPTRDFSYVGTSELHSREVDDDGKQRFYDYDAAGDRLGQQVSNGTDNRYRAYNKGANGSILGLKDDHGVIDDGGSDQKVASYEYDPYGELENAGDLSPEADDDPFRFEGFYFDSGVKTYDMLARPYRPDVGRFQRRWLKWQGQDPCRPSWCQKALDTEAYQRSHPIFSTSDSTQAEPSGSSGLVGACSAPTRHFAR